MHLSGSKNNALIFHPGLDLKGYANIVVIDKRTQTTLLIIQSDKAPAGLI